MGKGLGGLILLLLCIHSVFFIADSDSMSADVIADYANINQDDGTVSMNQAMLDDISSDTTSSVTTDPYTQTPGIGSVAGMISLLWRFVSSPLAMITQADMPFEFKLIFGLPYGFMLMFTFVSFLWRFKG